jgi:hypothetical protein
MNSDDLQPSASSSDAHAADEQCQSLTPDARQPRRSVDVNGRVIQAESQYSVAASALHMSHKQQLNICSLVCLIFLEVCGGPVRFLALTVSDAFLLNYILTPHLLAHVNSLPCS